MKRKVLLFSLCLSACLANSYAEKATSIDKDNTEKTTEEEPKKKSRLTLGGYGEAVYTRNFYSDNMYRYSKADSYKDSDGHGRVDLPHVVIMIGYDFGKGWSMGSEIEFEHGGTESAIEVEDEEAGEFEKEIERGGEVALEQFWIQKSFCSGFNIRAGHIIVPIGQINNAHLPTQFFTVYRPEGENTIMPCTWHETGLSVWGRIGDWRYEAMVLTVAGAQNATLSDAGNVISKLCMLLLSVLISHYMKVKNSPEISLRYFLVILLVPASSIYIMHNIFIIAAVYDEFSKFSVFSSLMLLLVNYVVFEIYDWMSRDAMVREQNRLYGQQLELCSRQAEERESLYLEIRRLRHDMKNYLSCLLGAVQTGEKKEAEMLIQEMLNDGISNRTSEVSRSGNIVGDYSQSKTVKISARKKSGLSFVGIWILYPN